MTIETRILRIPENDWVDWRIDEMDDKLEMLLCRAGFDFDRPIMQSFHYQSQAMVLTQTIDIPRASDRLKTKGDSQ